MKPLALPATLIASTLAPSAPALLAQGPALASGPSSAPTCPSPGFGLCSAPAWTSHGSGANDFYGTAVAAAGDVNGDGLDDYLVGAPHQQ